MLLNIIKSLLEVVSLELTNCSDLSKNAIKLFKKAQKLGITIKLDYFTFVSKVVSKYKRMYYYIALIKFMISWDFFKVKRKTFHVHTFHT